MLAYETRLAGRKPPGTLKADVLTGSPSGT